MSHSSNDIEVVIGKIDNLRLAHNQSNDVRGLDVHRTKLKERGVACCQTSKNTNTYDREHKHNKENNRDDLIERGPIKSQFCPLSRSQPYCARAEHPRFLEEASEIFSIDYDKTAEQILRDKECSEKLNACLDQLQNLERTNYNYSDDDRDQSVSQVCGSRKDCNVRLFLRFSSTNWIEVSDWFVFERNALISAFFDTIHDRWWHSKRRVFIIGERDMRSISSGPAGDEGKLWSLFDRFQFREPWIESRSLAGFS